MAKNIDDIYKELLKNNKETHNLELKLNKEISNIIKVSKNIEGKIKIIESKIDQAIEILNTFAVLISETEEMLEENNEYLDEDSQEWSPYDNPEYYESEDYDEDEEDS